MSVEAIDPAEFPLIGEPLPVEFANSLYESEGETIDFLADARLLQLWFEVAATDVVMPIRLRRSDGDAIRELRNAIRIMFCDIASDTVPDSGAVAVVNRYAGARPVVRTSPLERATDTRS